MSYRKCTPDEWSAALGGILDDYGDDVTARQKRAVDTTAKEVNNTIKEHITFKQHTHDYVNAFRVAKTYESTFEKRKTWYVAAPYYRLTHLLENGHATESGGRTQAYPHIKYGQEIAEQRMMELSIEAAKNGGH